MDNVPPDIGPQAARVAREANGYILALEERLTPSVGADRAEREIGLFCECGCVQVVTMTSARYEAAGGAWLDGHEPSDNSG